MSSRAQCDLDCNRISIYGSIRSDLAAWGTTDVITSTSWGVLVARHQQQELVNKALYDRGIDYFSPLTENLDIVRGRHVRSMKPLLGEYIPFAVSAGWKELLALRGVSGILLNERGTPAQVPPKEMQVLRDQCDGEIWRNPNQISTPKGFTYGQKVTPKDGALAYQVGRYDGATKRGDSALFLLFGREQRIVFKRGDLLAV